MNPWVGLRGGVILAGAVLAASALQASPRPRVQAPPEAAPPAAEDRVIRISEKRITQPSFHAEEALVTSSAERGISLRVGASMTTGQIDLTLRNVLGRVPFRASFDALPQLGLRPGPRPRTPDNPPLPPER